MGKQVLMKIVLVGLTLTGATAAAAQDPSVTTTSQGEQKLRGNKSKNGKNSKKYTNIEETCDCQEGETGYKPYKNCAGFVYCDANNPGVATPVMCESGLVFDPTLNVCNWPSSVKECPTSCNTVQPPLPPTEKCCEEGFIGHIAHDDCNGFIHCDGTGVETPHSCPPGTMWDVHVNTCNHAASVQFCPRSCNLNYVLEDPYDHEGDEEYNEQNDPSSAEGENDHSANSVQECSCDGFTGYKAINQCTGFVFCDSQNPVVRPHDCPATLLFDVAAGNCKNAEEVTCDQWCEYIN